MGKGYPSLFRELSAALTGVSVSAVTADRHLETLNAWSGTRAIERLLDRYKALQESGAGISETFKNLNSDIDLGPVLKQVALLWFTGLTTDKNGSGDFASQTDYLEAMMWETIGAHPPGMSNGYFGHWRNPPDSGV